MNNQNSFLNEDVQKIKETHHSKVKYPFSYFGGKIKLFDWICSVLPPAYGFVDLFGGSGTLALNLSGRYKRIVYNDLDGNLVNFFRVLRDRPDDLIGKLELTPISRQEHMDAMYGLDSEDDLERARCYFVRITQSFSGIGMRKQKTGWISPCFGTRVSSVLKRVENLETLVHLLIQMEIENRDAMTLIEKETDKQTLLFADPPYVPTTRNAKTAYLHEMTEEQHIDMASKLAASTAKVVVCGYRNDIYDEHFKDFERHERRFSSSTSRVKASGKEHYRTECLWVKNNV